MRTIEIVGGIAAVFVVASSAVFAYIGLLPRIVLWRVNRVRRVRGKAKLKQLQPGAPGQPLRCPVARSLEDCLVYTYGIKFVVPLSNEGKQKIRRAWNRSLLPKNPRNCDLPHYFSTRLFTELFDHSNLFSHYRLPN